MVLQSMDMVQTWLSCGVTVGDGVGATVGDGVGVFVGAGVEVAVGAEVGVVICVGAGVEVAVGAEVGVVICVGVRVSVAAGVSPSSVGLRPPPSPEGEGFWVASGVMFSLATGVGVGETKAEAVCVTASLLPFLPLPSP